MSPLPPRATPHTQTFLPSLRCLTKSDDGFLSVSRLFVAISSSYCCILPVRAYESGCRRVQSPARFLRIKFIYGTLRTSPQIEHLTGVAIRGSSPNKVMLERFNGGGGCWGGGVVVAACAPRRRQRVSQRGSLGPRRRTAALRL